MGVQGRSHLVHLVELILGYFIIGPPRIEKLLLRGAEFYDIFIVDPPRIEKLLLRGAEF